MPEKRRRLTEDEIPVNDSGERWPYDVVWDEAGDVVGGPSICQHNDEANKSEQDDDAR